MMEYRTLLVGIGHRARHGKNLLAQKIHVHIPELSRIYSFADALKTHARALGLMQEKNGKLLQDLGLMYRQKDPGFWIRLLALKLQEEMPPVALIPDLRFENEKRWIEDNQGLTIKIERLTAQGGLYVDPSRPADHPSEMELAGAEFHRSIQVPEGNFDEIRKAAVAIAGTITDRLSQPGFFYHEINSIGAGNVWR